MRMSAGGRPPQKTEFLSALQSVRIVFFVHVPLLPLSKVLSNGPHEEEDPTKLTTKLTTKVSGTLYRVLRHPRFIFPLPLSLESCFFVLETFFRPAAREVI
jgi:hypothetical protein